MRDYYKKLISKYKRKVREELNARRTSPEKSELDDDVGRDCGESRIN